MQLLKLIAQLFFHNRKGTVFCAVAGADVIYPGIFDFAGNVPNFLIALVEQMEAANQSVNVLFWEGLLYLVDDVHRPAV